MKKETKLSVYYLNVKIYRVEISLVVGSPNNILPYLKKHYPKTYKSAKQDVTEADGVTYFITKKNGCKKILIWIETKHLDDLNHECLHASVYILDNVGIEINFENDEALTYLHGYIFREFRLMMRKKKG